MEWFLNEWPVAEALGGVVLLVAVATSTFAVVKRFVPVKPIAVEGVEPFEQRRYYRPGGCLRAFAAFALGVALTGGAISTFWFIEVSPEWLVGLCFLALALTVVSAWLILRRAHCCPTYRATAMNKDYVHGVRIFVCNRCAVIWHTPYGDPNYYPDHGDSPGVHLD